MLNKKGAFEIIDIMDLCENYHDRVTGEVKKANSSNSGYTSYSIHTGMTIGKVIGGCSVMREIVSVQMFNIWYGHIGMVILDKNCKVYYLGDFGKGELCKQGMPDEFKI